MEDFVYFLECLGSVILNIMFGIAAILVIYLTVYCIASLAVTMFGGG